MVSVDDMSDHRSSDAPGPRPPMTPRSALGPDHALVPYAHPMRQRFVEQISVSPERGLAEGDRWVRGERKSIEALGFDSLERLMLYEELALARVSAADPADSAHAHVDHGSLLVELHDARALLAPDGRRPAAAAEFRSRWVELWVRCQELRLLNIRIAYDCAKGREGGTPREVVGLVGGELTAAVADLVSDLRGPQAVVLGNRGPRWVRSTSCSAAGSRELRRAELVERIFGDRR